MIGDIDKKIVGLLLAFPDEILRILCEEWLTTKDVFHLDTAVCNHFHLQRWKEVMHQIISPKYSCITSIRGHSQMVWRVMQLQDGRLASASADKSVIIWNTKDQEEHQLVHAGSISCMIQSADGRIITGSPKGICIWNNTTYKLEKVLMENSDPGVRSLLQLRDGRLATGSTNSLVRIWNLNTFECEKTLVGPSSNAVFSFLQLWDGRLVAGHLNGKIKFWSTSTWVCETTLEVCDSCRSLIQVNSNKLVVACGTRLEAWDISSYQSIRSIDFRKFVTSLCKLDNRRLVVGVGRSIIIWNWETYVVERICDGHNSLVLSVILLKNGLIASGSWDTSIKLWKPIVEINRK